MPSHFSSIGLPVHDANQFRRLIDRVASEARPVRVQGGRYLEWTSSTGAQVFIQLNAEGQLIGANPHFSGDARVRTAVTGSIQRSSETPLDGAFYAWAAPEGDDPETGCYPFVFDCPDSAAHAGTGFPLVTEVQIAAFAHSLKVWDSVDSYDAVASDTTRYASKSFIPSGLFSPDGESTEPPRAAAILTGHVESTKMQTNELTGAQFLWISVSSLCSSFDVAADPELLSASLPVAGGVVQGEFWLSGRLVKPGTPRPRGGWISRLRGKTIG